MRFLHGLRALGYLSKTRDWVKDYIKKYLRSSRINRAAEIRVPPASQESRLRSPLGVRPRGDQPWPPSE